MYPVLFEVGNFPVSTYGMLFALGIFLGIAFSAWKAPSVGVSADVVWEVGILVVVFTMLGSRAEYVRTHWSMFSEDFSKVFAYRDGGMVFYGGFFASVAAITIYGWLRRVDPLAVFDAIAPGVMLGTFVGRFGCLAAGCCYGAPSSLPWAIRFPEGAVAPEGIDRHPTQVYESIYALIIFGLILAIPRRFVGQRFAVLLALYGLARFVNEWFRGDARRGWAIDEVLTNGQLTSIFMVLGALLVTIIGVRSRTLPRPNKLRAPQG